MRFNLKSFLALYATEDACLEYLLYKRKLGHCKVCNSSRLYRVHGRKSFVCYNGHQVYPLKGTIFEKSRTPLNLWFYAIYLFSVSRNGVAATELQRHLGVTYKTAWRIGHLIRKLMSQDNEEVLYGIIEIDEVFIGGYRRSSAKYRKKIKVYGLIQRGGIAKAYVVDGVNKTVSLRILKDNVLYGSEVYTDDSTVYRWIDKFYKHFATIHSKYEFVRGTVHTNTIEGFWSQL